MQALAELPPSLAHAAARFFEDFDLPPSSRPPGRAARAAADAEAADAAALARARAEGFAAGEQHGAATAEAARRLQVDAMLDLLADRLEQAAHADQARAELAARDLARLLLAGLRAMFPSLCARHGASEAAAVARVVLPVLHAEPSVLVRVAPCGTATLQAEIARLPAEHAARITCMADAAMAPGDLRVEWRRGAAVRDTGAILQAVADALADEPPAPEYPA